MLGQSFVESEWNFALDDLLEWYVSMRMYVYSEVSEDVRWTRRTDIVVHFKWQWIWVVVPFYPVAHLTGNDIHGVELMAD